MTGPAVANASRVPPPGARVAVIGAGVAGLTAAHLLSRRHPVTLFERNGYAGGHTNTIVIPDGPDAGTAVDTGFIVMNHRNYPLFSRLIEQLGVRLQDSDMSFSYHCERTGFHYGGNGLDGLFAQRRHLVSARFWHMLSDIARFNRRAHDDLVSGRLAGLTLGEYVVSLELPHDFTERYLFAMAAAIWSSPAGEIEHFPAESFVRFFENHGLLAVTGQPTWRTVTGGSRTYVEALLARFPGRVMLSSGVKGVRREPDAVRVLTTGGAETFDAVVIATHADEAFGLLADPSEEERAVLGVWEYSLNHTVLHTDTRVLPPRRRAWCSWNHLRERAADGAEPVSLTYWMNRLQRLGTREQYCVTLNRRGSLDERRVLREMTYTHPRFTLASLASQEALPGLNGSRRTWYCGSYFGYGFHEDAVRSAVEVGRAFGETL